jgi:UDPglucose 6-dehydrogenase
MSFNISVIGTGYVGIVSGTTFAETGNKVLCVDIDAAKVDRMKKGESPIYEPGLELLLKRNIEASRLDFTTDLAQAVQHGEIIFLCLPTPPNEDGSADLQHVMKVAGDIADIISEKKIERDIIVINKSTVPVGTGDQVKSIFDSKLGDSNRITIASNPEFLREGFAVEDAMKPERIVIGTGNEDVAEKLEQLYMPFVRSGAPIFIFDIKSAEVTKYAANSFLATKISFMNDLSAYCEKVGADIENVRRGIGSDTRIGKRFLFAGVGYGGSCFPKDVRALAFSAREAGTPLKIVEATQEVNKDQINRFSSKVKSYFGESIEGRKLSVWGLAFKPNTDDIREAPAFEVIEDLLAAGAIISAYDEEAIGRTKERFGDRIEYADSPYKATEDSSALLIITEWNAFRNPDFDKLASTLKDKVIFDGRNLYDPEMIEKMGFKYFSIGRRQIG